MGSIQFLINETGVQKCYVVLQKQDCAKVKSKVHQSAVSNGGLFPDRRGLTGPSSLRCIWPF